MCKVIITTLSIILFNCEDSGKSGDNSQVFKSVLIGYGLLLISLFFDGLMALKEKIINHETHHNPEYAKYKPRLSWEYMNLFSLYTIMFYIFVIGYEFMFKDLSQSLMVYLQSKELIINVLCYASFNSLGQVFLFHGLEKYGPLTLSIITGVRKILSIALSIVFFGKIVSIIKIISLALGMTVILWEVLEKTSGKNKSKDNKSKENEKAKEKKEN